MALSALSNISRLSKNKSKKQVLNTPDGKLTISPVTGWTSTTVGNEVTVQFKTTDVSYEILANQTMDISCCVVGGGGGGGGTPAQIGSENTGGGGGASSASGSAPSGGNGGSGIVILVYNLV